MELKNLTLEDLKRVSVELQREIDEREQTIFEEDCKELAEALQKFYNKNYPLCCYVDIECDHCERNIEIDLWDYIENIIDNLERNCK